MLPFKGHGIQLFRSNHRRHASAPIIISHTHARGVVVAILLLR